MNNFSVSVLIAAFNAEKFLDTTLASVSWQSVQVDQVVIVDDCSTDGTKRVVDSWKSRLPIRYIRNETNLGVGASRNIGLDNVSTELVAVLDADDIWLPSHLSILMERMVSVRTVVSPRAVVWPDGRGLVFEPKYAKDTPQAHLQFQKLCQDNFVFSGSLFSMKMVDEVGKYPEIRIGEDYLFWLKAVSAGFLIVKPEEITVLYRQRSGSLSSINSVVFRDLGASIASHLQCFNPSEQIYLHKMINDLRMRELLCSFDEEDNRRSRSFWSILFPVIFKGSLRLKASAIVRLLGLGVLTKKSYNQLDEGQVNA